MKMSVFFQLVPRIGGMANRGLGQIIRFQTDWGSRVCVSDKNSRGCSDIEFLCVTVPRSSQWWGWCDVSASLLGVGSISRELAG